MSSHLHPNSALSSNMNSKNHQGSDHTSTSSDELERIIAEARAASKYPSTSSKRASSPCPSTTSTDSARRRREADDGYNPIQYEYEKKGGFKDWWRRQRLDNPHGAAALIEAIGQGFTRAFGDLARAGY
ncbi:General transcription factor II-I repeat domain-containing protein 2B [Lasiodiplodia theobromae]|uniref:General transcription factor II-I repeat domain-containing protein 2B n=1 Tax=Lasiodiplodia theobromae TaxID=45133 RepID=UPI0015C38686|nr:General transcription factor II-I repeat domain-containing protein 2B [Lasiodiplodia theobromae]KAF4540149.1 General transcription factor II-I repeat domain-containing protein 2B [Lasiodiplodia theobromae]